MSDTIKPVGYVRSALLAWLKGAPQRSADTAIVQSKTGTQLDEDLAALYDQSAIEQARQEGFSDGYEKASRTEYSQTREIADLRRQLAAAQAYAYEQNSALRCAVTQLCDCGRFLPSYDYRAIAEKNTAEDALDAYLDERERETIERCAKEAEHWQEISDNGHCCGQYIAGAIRALPPENITHSPESAQPSHPSPARSA